ncbi:integrase catalytic domain-containing protein [Trichonephila inaurata madagascariensis]|uniref:Integrase catalytic domain-containing protein n=1 Tax=Trichonephila inaurata madagascariensis TaxID=2747483 RepID=A0A8X7BTH1_9ARAC|nr:integrase catalytic domain-containing protein [Trichonephila inaurata madagascariensis]
MTSYTNQEMADIHFIYGVANENDLEARRLYGERFPSRRLLNRKTFERLHRRLSETGSFVSGMHNTGRNRNARTPELEEHFEKHWVTSISTECFIQAFRRFIARRGQPSIVYSDNGTNFVGVSAGLKKVDWEKVVVSQETLNPITWKFIPPTAAWWEIQRHGHNDCELKVGDIVLVGCENLKRVNWHISRVQELSTGRDGHVRVVKVKTSGGVFLH